MLLRSFRSVALLLTLAILLPQTALAHERRPVGERYQLVVGFLSEPAIANQLNGVDLRVSTVADGKPVEGIEKTLKVELIVGGGARTMEVPLQARFGQPGSYAAHFMPTREGSYIFHFTGSIEGTAVDERFESGPGRFDDVKAVQPIQFPDRLPDPASTAAEIAAARQEANSARTFGIAGLVVGLLGLVVGGASLATRRRDSGTAEARPGTQSG